MGAIVVASGNRHKHEEITRILAAAGGPVEVLRPADLLDGGRVLGGRVLGTPPPDPVEDGSTYLENATIKARAFSEWCGLPALADDSGLEVAALGGAPGLHSSRYAGEDADFAANIAKLLGSLEETGNPDRSARFVCQLVLWADGGVAEAVEGSCEGTIVEAPRGVEGFGYDPIFRPEGETRVFAELSETEKDARSHRGRALRAFAARFAERSSDRADGGPPSR